MYTQVLYDMMQGLVGREYCGVLPQVNEKRDKRDKREKREKRESKGSSVIIVSHRYLLGEHISAVKDLR